MPGQLLIDFLDGRGASYNRLIHNVAYTAPEVAEQCHVQGGRFAKVVMIKADAELAMMVIPAHYYLDLVELSDELSVGNVILAREDEFARRFPRCEIGAMPPFGHLYGLQTYMVNIFPEDDYIAFNAGNHSEIITMPLSEYLSLACVTELNKGVTPVHLSNINEPFFSPSRKFAPAV